MPASPRPFGNVEQFAEPRPRHSRLFPDYLEVFEGPSRPSALQLLDPQLHGCVTQRQREVLDLGLELGLAGRRAGLAGRECGLACFEELGLPVDHVRLSLRDGSDSYLGLVEDWHVNQEALRAAAHLVLADEALEIVEAQGEAAFYGPKLDLQVRDGRGHEESIATVQLDVNQPARFDLAYVDQDSSRQRCVMIHRGTVGAMERVVASLMERYQGRLPL